ncbi:10393_t:CDS:10 [Scutellospora calospora]|uniref:10393_t:CDS:1 n=1 Tax=Scutellospora calospora TaxID=85575 RepID=A0ACA9K090_9GLOM|nr:10393_t:CDS:10 [Scutellospora calospora]
MDIFQLASRNNDKKSMKTFLNQYLNGSKSDMETVPNELSSLLHNSPNVYIPTLNTLVSYIRKMSSLKPHYLNFVSPLIMIVIKQNLQYHSDIHDFRELLSSCVELIWLTKQNKDKSHVIQTIEHVLSTIIEINGVLGVLISELSSCRFLKRVLFNYNMIDRIKNDKLLRMVDVIISLIEKCPEHIEEMPKLSESKAYSSLIESLSDCQNAKRRTFLATNNNILPPVLYEMDRLNSRERFTTSNFFTNFNNSISLSAEDEQLLKQFGIEIPQRISDLRQTLRTLEQRKIESFRDLIRSLPCPRCHRNALIDFCPNKYSSLLGEEFEEIEGASNAPECLFRLPFEFDDNDKLGPWDILLSEDAIKDIQQLESLVIDAVMKRLQQISYGRWDKYRFQCITQHHNIPIYVVEVPGNKNNLKMLWQVDCGFSIRKYSITQLIKVWAVAEKIDETLKNLLMAHKVYTVEHSNMCTARQISQGINLPIIFDVEEVTKSSDIGLCYDERQIEIHKMLVTNKFTPISKKFFQSLNNGGLDFTFQVSKIEYEFINHPTSAIVIGRSGTGKTTSIVLRLIASYLANQQKRQIFITVSKNLCHKVKEYFNRIKESVMLVNEKSKTRSSRSMTNRKTSYMKQDQDDIPTSFRQLTDDCFPLFITYDQFSQMLLETYKIDIRKLIKQQKFNTDNDEYDDEDEFCSSSIIYNEVESLRYFVDYQVFTTKYWPRLSDQYRQKLDCELVYSEFSVIKGIHPEVDYLSKEDYIAISTKKYPTFCHDREKIYELFQQYEKLKSRNGDYDSIDRTQAICHFAKKHALGCPHIHEVYIDECQDNQIVDIALIMKLFDSANGFFFAGDVAQCIARGSSFRFQDLRSLMYFWELQRPLTNYNLRGTRKPKQFELNINYRSHNGILQLASSVIDLIWHFFPDSIDKLSCERSEVGGPKPVVFSEVPAEELLNRFSVDKEKKHTTNHIEFGAKQMIIVRDEKTKQNVVDLIGDAGMVETVFDCKGMEYNDVLLYNFFTDSPAHKKWRVIHSILENNEKGTPAFSHEKYCILSSELKQLYVSVTRARQRIIIFDENVEYSDPICAYWEQKKLIRISKNADEIVNFAKESSVEEWKQQGEEFFEKEKYNKKSGDKELLDIANAYRLKQIARTSVSCSDNATIKENFINAARAFNQCSNPIQEASCYEGCGMYNEASDIYIKQKKYELAARSYLKAKIWQKAGKCFEEANKYTDAVLAYKDGELYDTVISLLERKKLEIDRKIFDKIVHILYFNYRQKENEVMSESILSILETQDERNNLMLAYVPEEIKEAEELCLCGEFEKAANMFIQTVKDYDTLTKSLQCLLQPCRTYALNAIIDINFKRFINKADIVVEEATLQPGTLRKMENLIKELQLYKAYLNNDLDQIYECIEFFKNCGDFIAEFRAINIWLKLTQTGSHVKYWLEHLRRICEMAIPFMSIYDNEEKTDDFEKLLNQRQPNRPNHSFARIIEKMNEKKEGKITNYRKDYEKIHKDFEKIFVVNTTKNSLNNRQISFNNPLTRIINEMNVKKEKVIDGYWQIKKNIIYRAITKFLSSYIKELILRANMDSRRVSDIAFKICSEFSSSGKCQIKDCQEHHVKSAPLILSNRLKLASLQYTIFHQLYETKKEFEKFKVFQRFFDEFKEFNNLQRFWAENLFRNHFCYQYQRQKITDVVISDIIDDVSNGFIDLINVNDFEIIFKYLLISMQFRRTRLLEKFRDKVTKIKCNSGVIVEKITKIIHDSKTIEEKVKCVFEAIQEKVSEIKCNSEFISEKVSQIKCNYEKAGAKVPKSSEMFGEKILESQRYSDAVGKKVNEIKCNSREIVKKVLEIKCNSEKISERISEEKLLSFILPLYYENKKFHDKVTKIKLNSEAVKEEVTNFECNSEVIGEQVLKIQRNSESIGAKINSEKVTEIKCNSEMVEEIGKKVLEFQYNSEAIEIKIKEIKCNSEEIKEKFSEIKRNSEAIGTKLLSFIMSLYSENTITFNNILEFINYTLKNVKSVKLNSLDAFDDLMSLMEFTTTLIIVIRSIHSDFCLPKSYLFNCYKLFNINRLSSKSYEFNIEDLEAMLNQIEQFLNLISTSQHYSTIVHRLIRNLALIGLNENILMSKILNLLKHLPGESYSAQCKKYLFVSRKEDLVNILNDDFNKTGSDFLVISYLNDRIIHEGRPSLKCLEFNKIQGNSHCVVKK